MKKTLAVLLSLLIILSTMYCCFGVLSFAGDDFTFEPIKTVVGEDGKVPYIDFGKNLIYGFDIGAENLADYIVAGEGYYLIFEGETLGTGAKLYVTTEEGNKDKAVITFEVVLFGDLNGDGVIDVLDTSLNELMGNGHIASEEVFNTFGFGMSYDAFKKSADINCDGIADINDYGSSVNAAIGVETLCQQRCEPEAAANAETVIDTQLYGTGDTLQPEIELNYNGKVLQEGTDYTVSYSQDIENLIGYVTVAGVEGGLFTGSKTFSYVIELKDADSIKVKFENTANMLYRIGNMNSVSVSSLFCEDGEVDTSKVTITVEKVNGTADCTYTADTENWLNGTLNFSGTGVVNVTAKHGTADPVSLKLEVVSAKNVTTATSATANNVVLLNDVIFTEVLTVSNGYSLYGNGFTMTAPNDVTCSTIHSDCGFVTLKNGTLDNVRVVCPIFAQPIYYLSQAKNYTDEKGKYLMTRSGIDALGNSKICNSYISGGRASIFTGDGCNTLLIENTTVAGGTFANMDLYAGKSIILRDVTTVMTEQTVTADTSKQVIGLGIVVSSSTLKLTLEGTLKQFNWISEEQADTYLSDYSTLTDKIFGYTKFQHTYNSTTYMNTGIAYMANWDVGNVADNMPQYLYDNRENKAGYEGQDITIGGISGGAYSVNSSVALTDELFNAPTYVSEKYNIVSPIFSFSNTVNEIAKTSDTEPYCTYSDALINVGIKDTEKTLDFSGVSIVKDGVSLDYTMTVNSENATINGNSITFTTDETDYTVTFTATENSKGYNADGTVIEGTTTYSWDISVHIAVLTYDKPVWDSNISATGSENVWVVDKPGQSDPDYSEAIPIYGGLTVTYYDKSGIQHTDDLSTETVIPTVDSGNNFATATLSNGCVLKITTAHSGYEYQLCNGKIYLYKTTTRNNRDSFNKAITYSLTDPNGQTTESTVKVTYTFSESAPGVYIKLSDFKNGTYTTCSGEASCLAKGTLITLADGSQKKIEDLTYSDKILVWDFFTGTYAEKNISILVDHGEKTYDVVYTTYSDGTVLKTIGEHGVFDYDENKFVYLTPENCKDYIGHKFVKYSDDGSYDIVILTDAFVKTEVTTAYSITSAGMSNAFAEGLLTVAPPDDFYNWIESDGKLHYNVEQFNEDVATYGLYDYDVFKDYVTYRQFVDFNGAYLKIAVEKGYFTFDYIIELIEMYSQWMPE